MQLTQLQRIVLPHRAKISGIVILCMGLFPDFYNSPPSPALHAEFVEAGARRSRPRPSTGSERGSGVYQELPRRQRMGLLQRHLALAQHRDHHWVFFARNAERVLWAQAVVDDHTSQDQAARVFAHRSQLRALAGEERCGRHVIKCVGGRASIASTCRSRRPLAASVLAS